MIIHSRRGNRAPRLAGVLIAAACALGMLAPASASASTSPAARHHAIPVAVLGNWVHYKHKHGSASGARHCPGTVISEIDASRHVFIWDKKNWFFGGPGGKVSGSVTKTTHIGATISAGATISISDLISDASVTVSASVTRSDSTTLGHAYSHKVPAHKIGNIEYGALGYQLQWSQWQETANCRAHEIGQGSGMVPTVALGFHYWSSN